MNEPGVGASLPDSEWARPVLLQQAREQAGLHIAALAAALKVPVRKLEALEAGRYDELPDLTFARALASSACRHLRVDPGPVLAQIPQGRRPALGDMSESLNTPFRPAQEPSGASAQLGPARRVWWVAGLLLVAALALYYWPGATDFMRPAQTPPEFAQTAPLAPASGAPLSAPALEEGKPATEQALPLLLPDTSGEPSAPVPPVPVEAAGSATGPVAAATSSAPDASKLLVIRAQSETWVEVVNGSGSVVIQRVLRAGDSIEFSAAPPYRVIVGRADVVEVFVRGRPFDVMPHARNSVARFEVR